MFVIHAAFHEKKILLWVEQNYFDKIVRNAIFTSFLGNRHEKYNLPSNDINQWLK